MKLMDFGISKVTDATLAGDVNALTANGAMMGSPSYMSPEQVRSARDVNPRSDIWALGVVLFELLAASPPFVGETVGETFAKILNDPPTPLASVRSDLPAGLVAVVAQCLQKSVDQRIQSVSELALRLLPFAGGQAARSIDRIRRYSGPRSSRASGVAPAAESHQAPVEARSGGSNAPDQSSESPPPSAGTVGAPEGDTGPPWLRSAAWRGASPRGLGSLGLAAAVGALLCAAAVAAYVVGNRATPSPSAGASAAGVSTATAPAAPSTSLVEPMVGASTPSLPSPDSPVVSATQSIASPGSLPAATNHLVPPFPQGAHSAVAGDGGRPAAQVPVRRAPAGPSPLTPVPRSTRMLPLLRRRMRSPTRTRCFLGRVGSLPSDCWSSRPLSDRAARRALRRPRRSTSPRRASCSTRASISAGAATTPARSRSSKERTLSGGHQSPGSSSGARTSPQGSSSRHARYSSPWRASPFGRRKPDNRRPPAQRAPACRILFAPASRASSCGSRAFRRSRSPSTSTARSFRRRPSLRPACSSPVTTKSPRNRRRGTRPTRPSIFEKARRARSSSNRIRRWQ